MEFPIIVSVVGPSNPSNSLYEDGVMVGRLLGKTKEVVTICGGLYGIMEAVSKGVSSEGGTVIGILPGESKRTANSFVTIPLATGLGHFRNYLIAQMCDFMVALGESPGTVTEVSMALRLGKQVLLYMWQTPLPGAKGFTNLNELVEDIHRLIGELRENQD